MPRTSRASLASSSSAIAALQSVCTPCGDVRAVSIHRQAPLQLRQGARPRKLAQCARCRIPGNHADEAWRPRDWRECAIAEGMLNRSNKGQPGQHVIGSARLPQAAAAGPVLCTTEKGPFHLWHHRRPRPPGLGTKASLDELGEHLAAPPTH